MVVVDGVAVEDDNSAACDTRDRLGKAVIHAALEPAGVEGIKIRVQRRVTLDTARNDVRNGDEGKRRRHVHRGA